MNHISANLTFKLITVKRYTCIPESLTVVTRTHELLQIRVPVTVKVKVRVIDVLVLLCYFC